MFSLICHILLIQIQVDRIMNCIIFHNYSTTIVVHLCSWQCIWSLYIDMLLTCHALWAQRAIITETPCRHAFRQSAFRIIQGIARPKHQAGVLLFLDHAQCSQRNSTAEVPSWRCVVSWLRALRTSNLHRQAVFHLLSRELHRRVTLEFRANTLFLVSCAHRWQPTYTVHKRTSVFG